MYFEVFNNATNGEWWRGEQFSFVFNRIVLFRFSIIIEFNLWNIARSHKTLKAYQIRLKCLFVRPSVRPSVQSDRTTDRPFVFDCPQWIFNAFSVALFVVVVVRYVWQIIMDHKILILLWLFRIIAAWPLDVCHRWTWEYTCMSVCLYIPWYKKSELPRSQFSLKAIVLIIFIEVLF